MTAMISYRMYAYGLRKDALCASFLFKTAAENHCTFVVVDSKEWKVWENGILQAKLQQPKILGFWTHKPLNNKQIDNYTVTVRIYFK